MTRAITTARVLLLACLTLAVVAATAPTSASASAYGYAYWGVHVFKDIPVPSGQLFGAVRGNGLRVDQAGGEFLAAGNLCNWHIDVDFYDASKARYNHVQGSNHPNCTREGGEKYGLGGLRVRPGRACVRLYRDFGNERLASVCHAITV
jgi:hypothetical protein